MQALRHLGPTRADDVVRIAAQSLSVTDKKRLGTSVRQAPAWMRPTLLAITTVGLENVRRSADTTVPHAVVP